MWVNADHGRDLYLLAHHMTKLQNYTMEQSRDFSAFRFSLEQMFEQTLTNLIVCLMVSQTNYIQKLHK